MPRYRWLIVLLLTTGCDREAEAPAGLRIAFSSDALSATSSLVVRTYEIGKLLDAAKPCAQGAILTSESGSIVGAKVACATVAAGVHGTLRDETGVVAIDGDGPAQLTLRRVSGGRRLFESQGDLVGFRGEGSLVGWRWWVPTEALRSLPGLEAQHPALLLLDGRTSGVIYPGTVPSLAMWLGMRSTVSDDSLLQLAGALAERLGSTLDKRQIAGRQAACIDGRGLLDEFAPCAISLPEHAGIAIGFNEATLRRAVADIGPSGPPTMKVDFKLMTESDNAIEGIVAWPCTSVVVTPGAAGSALLTVVK